MKEKELILGKGTDMISIKELSNTILDEYNTHHGSDGRSLLKATIKPQNIWDSYYSSKALHSGYGGYNEIVTMDGKTNILTVKVEASKFKSMFDS